MSLWRGGFPPHTTVRRGPVGETWFLPRERAGGERRRSCVERLGDGRRRLRELRRFASELDEVARDEVPTAGDVDERRLLLVRARRRTRLERAAGAEAASRRRLRRARDVAGEDDALARPLDG